MVVIEHPSRPSPLDIHCKSYQCYGSHKSDPRLAEQKKTDTQLGATVNLGSHLWFYLLFVCENLEVAHDIRMPVNTCAFAASGCMVWYHIKHDLGEQVIPCVQCVEVCGVPYYSDYNMN